VALLLAQTVSGEEEALPITPITTTTPTATVTILITTMSPTVPTTTVHTSSNPAAPSAIQDTTN
jgi:hypothetical protein